MASWPQYVAIQYGFLSVMMNPNTVGILQRPTSTHAVSYTVYAPGPLPKSIPHVVLIFVIASCNVQILSNWAESQQDFDHLPS